MNVGFIGLGIMGRPMAANLAKGGHKLHAYDHKPVPAALLDLGAVACGSAKEVAQKSDVVITMVPDTPHVASALFDPGGVVEGLSPGKIVVDKSSISPSDTEAVAEALLFASKMGADPARVQKALLGGFAASRVLEVHGERMVKRTFDPGFRIELHQKDLNLALSNARQVGLSLPNTATAQELF